MLSMKLIKKYSTLCLLMLLSCIAKAQFVPSTLPSIPAANTDPTVKEIFRKLEDTLQVKQGEIKVEEVKKSQNLAKGFSPRKEDADEQLKRGLKA